MRITITRRSATEQAVAIVREDASHASFRLPAKGPLPHDAVHFCVETVLGLRHAFAVRWHDLADGGTLHLD